MTQPAAMEVDFSALTATQDLCDLIQAMSLRTQEEELQRISPRGASSPDIIAALPCEPTMNSDSPPAPSHSCLPNANANAVGCAYLQHLQSQVLNGYTTTGGEYIDSIFTHRELAMAFPPDHRQCAIGWSEIAKLLDEREWRADREGDVEAAKAFRYEAWWLASWI